MKSHPALAAASFAVLAFLFAPIAIVAVYAFAASNVQSWPIAGLSLRWFGFAWRDPELRQALGLSLQVAALATAVASVLGTISAVTVHRLPARAATVVSFLLVLPVALPGIITGMAMNAYFAAWGIALGWPTIVVAHATFCLVIVHNTVLARLRRLPSSLAEASADLGAGPGHTFRHVTLPLLASAIGAGALLAFALSFDEVIVTTFTAGVQTTLPVWILGAIRLGQRLPEVNVVAFTVILATALPVLLAQRLSQDAARV